MRTYVCSSCAETYPIEPGRWRCSCGAPLDLSPLPPGPLRLDGTLRSLWRYRAALAFDPTETAWRSITLGEGGTPLVAEPPEAEHRRSSDRAQRRAAGRDHQQPGVYLKLDFLMPTLSYKDRGAAVLVSKAAELGVGRLVADSSGNAGTAIAAYAGRAGIDAEVFVPASTSRKKLDQLRGFGATVRQVSGDRTDAAGAALERVGAAGAFYASHVYNPFFLEGTKTFAYEVWEQLGRRLPGTLVVPAGNGTILLGAALGFRELLAAGVVEGRPPRLVAVQSDRCDPVAAAWADRNADLSRWTTTVAEGIAIPAPPRLSQMLQAVRASDGICLTAADEQIGEARAALATRGVDVEPTAAAVWAAWRAWPRSSNTPTPVVMALSGAGLKASPTGESTL